MNPAVLYSVARWFLVLVIPAIGLLGARIVLAEIEYLYDQAGRLTGVMAGDGATALYTYDATGNILAVDRVESASLTVMQFSPSSGPPGSEITLWGHGFATAAGANQVTFNGVGAEVLSVSGHRMVVQVPIRATSGRIVVSNGTGSAVSRTDFVVAHSNLAPALTAFSPAMGAAHAEVTVEGSGFRPDTLNNRVRFNLSIAGVRTATPSRLVTAVPPMATSGPLSIHTPHGMARSTTDFFVVPGDRKSEDIAYTGRIAVGAETGITLAHKKTGLLLFDGTQGRRLYLVASPVAFAGGFTLTLLAPNAQALLSKTVRSADTFVLAPLPATGTYTLRVDAASSAGSVTLAVKSVLPVPLDGESVVAATRRSGEKLVFSVGAAEGQWLGLGIHNQFTDGAKSGRLRVLLPDGATLYPPEPLSCDQIWNGTNRCSLRRLPAAGIYTLIVDPAGTGTVGTTITASNDLRAAREANGPDFLFATRRSGQNAHLTFDGNAGDSIGVSLAENTFAGPVTIALWDDQGRQIRGSESEVIGSGSVWFANLPVAGKYHVLVAPDGSATGSARVAMVSELRTTVETDGDARFLDLRPGQQARLRFSARARQWLGLGLTTDVEAGYSAYVRILAPDGSSHRTYVPNDCNRYWSRVDHCSLRNLPQDGVYQIEIRPAGVRATKMTITLSSDRQSVIEANGEPVVFFSERHGQNGRFTFEGRAGETVSAALLSNQYPEKVHVALFAPDGTQVYGGDTIRGEASLDFSPLSQTGNHSLWIAPAKLDLASTQVRLLRTRQGVLEVDGAPFIADLLPGQNARLTFSARAGQDLALGLRPLGASMGSVRVQLLLPDGHTLDTKWSGKCNAVWKSAGRCALSGLPVTGEYTLLLDPEGVRAAGMSVTLSNERRDGLGVNGAAISVQALRHGQASFIDFDARVGQRHALHWSESSLDGARLSLLNADGRVQVSRVINRDTSASGTLDLGALTGAIRIHVEPLGISLGSVTLRVTAP